MERYLIIHCLEWKMNITTPYHFSDCIQGMGCLFWSDFEPQVRREFRKQESKATSSDRNEQERVAHLLQYRMVLVLIQFRKYINYFVEQSLINGLWGHFPQDVIAISSIVIARFEMLSIYNVRWKRKKTEEKHLLRLAATWNDGLLLFMNTAKKFSLTILEECTMQIYSTVFHGAAFPFEEEVGQHYQKLKNTKANFEIMIQNNNLDSSSPI